ncbi:NifU family protein [Buchananella hordeovulneris]|uniref:NifU family protein n=1 Tax=Buchananella hordeovulneris TaxID=52770 RepID=UPI00163A1803|nr:NifU family protein [Buchananella hordeovulneris]MDO5081258.1 NifU family protein [Buchananella hordeovulneris]
MTVAFHPESGRRAAEIVWVVTAGPLPLAADLADDPALAALRTGGQLAAVQVEASQVTTVAAPAHSWATLAPLVRAALTEALTRAGQGPELAAARRRALLRETEALLAGELGDYLRSHGGQATLRQAGEDWIEVELTGTCRNCPASAFTLRGRLERQLQARCPWLKNVRQATSRSRLRR